MVDRITRISPSTPPLPLTTSYPYASPAPNSSITSLEESPSIIFSFFKAIVSFLKWIFDLNPPQSPDIDLSADPSTLAESDPFRNKVFNFSPEGIPSLNLPRKYELACHIFQTLGGGGPFHWLKNKWHLERWEKELISLPGDPFEFLYFLTNSQTMLKAMISFKQNAESSSEKGICYLVGRRPWIEFIAKQSESFTLRGKPEMIPGFCQILKLDQTLVSSLFNAQKWEELVNYILEHREKQLPAN